MGQVAWSVWAGFGDAAEGDLEAGGAEFADVAVHVPLAVVVVRAEVLISHAGVSQQLGGLQLGVPGGGARLGRAALAGQSPAAGAFAGLGPAGCHGGLAGDGARVPVAFLGPGASGALAGLASVRGAAGKTAPSSSPRLPPSPPRVPARTAASPPAPAPPSWRRRSCGSLPPAAPDHDPMAPGSSRPARPCRYRCRPPGPGTAARRSPRPRVPH